jgi:GT2 family glycosyltransferase
LNIRIVPAGEKGGAAYARNCGARRAKGKKLIFVDADDVVAPGYLSAMAAALAEHDFVMSAFDYETLNPPWVRAAYRGFGRDPRNPMVPHFGVLPSAGGSIGISRAVFDAVGGFPEEMPRMQDIALSWEVQSSGTTLEFVPSAVCRVRYRSTFRGLFRQGLAGGSCAPLLYKRYRGLGMRRRTGAEVLRSWGRLIGNIVRARQKADLATVVVQLARELGRLQGSVRYRVFFP